LKRIQEQVFIDRQI